LSEGGGKSFGKYQKKHLTAIAWIGGAEFEELVGGGGGN